MTYDPNRMDQKGREAAYGQVWVTAGLSVVMLASNFAPLGAQVEGFCGLIVGAWFLTFAFYNRFDDYFMGLVKVGAIWSLALLGLWMAVQGLVSVFEGFYGLGYTAAGAQLPPDDATFPLPDKFNSAWLLASACAAAFFAGFLYTHHRGSGEIA